MSLWRRQVPQMQPRLPGCRVIIICHVNTSNSPILRTSKLKMSMSNHSMGWARLVYLSVPLLVLMSVTHSHVGLAVDLVCFRRQPSCRMTELVLWFMDVQTSNELIAVVTRPMDEATFEASKTRMSTPANSCELVLACSMVRHSCLYIHSRWMHDKPRIPPGDFECSEISSKSTVNDTVCLHARVHI